MQQPIEILPDISRINSIPFPDFLRKTSLIGGVGSVDSWKEWQEYLARVEASNLPTALTDISTAQAYIKTLEENDNDDDVEEDIKTLKEFLDKMKRSLSARTGASPTLGGSLSSSGFTAASAPLNITQIFENKATGKSLETDEYLSQVTKESLTLDQHSGIVTCTKNKSGISSLFAQERSFNACIIRGNSITLTPSLFSSSAPTSSSNHVSPPENPAQQSNIKDAFRIAATLIAEAAPAGSTILIHGRSDEMTIERIRASIKIFEKHNLHYEITQDLAAALASNPLEEKDQDFLSGIQIHNISGPSPSSPSSSKSPTPTPFGD